MSVFARNPITADKIPRLIKITHSQNPWLGHFQTKGSEFSRG